MKVEVNSEDLETLIFATGVIKTIEGALQQRERDPFVQPHLQYTEAVNKLNNALLHAKRAKTETAIDWDQPLTKEEVSFLKEVHALFENTSEYTKVDAASRLTEDGSLSVIDTLAAKGCIVIGQTVVGQIWAGASQPSLKPVPYYSIKTTERGIAALKQYENKSQTLP